jgi:hypothetical protein
MQLSISSSGSVAANVRFGKQLSRQLSRKSMVNIRYENIVCIAVIKL